MKIRWKGQQPLVAGVIANPRGLLRGDRSAHDTCAQVADVKMEVLDHYTKHWRGEAHECDCGKSGRRWRDVPVRPVVELAGILGHPMAIASENPEALQPADWTSEPGQRRIAVR